MSGDIAANGATDLSALVKLATDVSLNRPAEVLHDLKAAGGCTPALAATLRRHQLGRAAVRVLRAGGITDPAVDQLEQGVEGAHRVAQVPADLLLAAFDELRGALDSVGVPVLLVKGATLAARLYGGVDCRPQYDADVLVRRGDARAARGAIEVLGYRRIGRDTHSTTLRRDELLIDLHHALRTAPAYRIDEPALWRASRQVAIEGIQVPTLADGDTLALLATSLVEDVGTGIAKLRNLCDIWLLTMAMDSRTDWDAWFDLRSEERLEVLAVNACWLSLTALDVLDQVPHLAAAMARRGSLVRCGSQQECLALLGAGRGSVENMAWFGRIYPGSLLRYRLHSLVGGLPGSLAYLRPGRVRFHIGLLRARRTRRSPEVQSDRQSTSALPRPAARQSPPTG